MVIDCKNQVKMSKKSSNNSDEVRPKIEAEIRSVFDRFDLPDSPGFMSCSQLRYALRAFGFEPKKEQVKHLTNEFADKDDPSVISWASFLSCVLRKFDEKDTNEEILKAFELFDQSGNGMISLHDLRKVAQSLGENIPDEELKEMISEADLNKDQYVDKHEFLIIMKKTALY